MKTPEIIEEIGDFNTADNKFGISGLCDLKSNDWINSSDLEDKENFIVFADDGGDTFVKYADNSEDLVNKLRAHLDGDTGADFDTSIRLIVQNGQKKTMKDFIK